MNYRNMQNNKREKAILLNNIGIVSFAMVELNLYLDTHPNDEEAMEYFMHFTKNRNMLLKEYAMNYGPLVLDMVSDQDGEWKWATGPMPWEGEC